MSELHLSASVSRSWYCSCCLSRLNGTKPSFMLLVVTPVLSLLWKSKNVCCEKGPSVNIIHFCAVHLCAPNIKTHQLWWHTFIASEFWDHRIYLYVWEKMTIWLEDTEHTVWMDSREVDYAAVIGQKVFGCFDTFFSAGKTWSWSVTPSLKPEWFYIFEM